MTPLREESRLGEESLEDGSDDSEYGEMGLANGDTPKTSRGTKERGQILH